MVKIKEGKFYKMQDGRKVGPMVYDGSGGYFFVSGQIGCWLEDGSPEDSVTRRKLGSIISECPEGPVRTVTRREISPGTYGHVYVKGEVKNHPMGRVCLVGVSSTTDTIGLTADELRSAAMIFSQLAEALDSREEAK